MANFCECGSLILNDKCSNKHCSFKKTQTHSKKVQTSVNLKSPSNKKTTDSRRSSRCVTYKLSEYEEKQKES